MISLLISEITMLMWCKNVIKVKMKVIVGRNHVFSVDPAYVNNAPAPKAIRIHRINKYRVDLAGDNWKLALSDAKVQDSGIYCCHVSTNPPMLRRVRLTVHPPEITMSKEAFLETGETLSLKCAVLHLHSREAAPTLQWYRGNSTVPLDEIRGGVLVETDHLTMTSHLQVARLKVDDAGNYTCSLHSPIRMKAVARVHVLQGSSLAELQSGVKTKSSYASLLLSMLLVLVMRYEDR